MIARLGVISAPVSVAVRWQGGRRGALNAKPEVLGFLSVNARPGALVKMQTPDLTPQRWAVLSFIECVLYARHCPKHFECID